MQKKMLPAFLQLCSQINIALHDLACMTWRWQWSDVARSSALHLLLMLSFLWKVCGEKCTRPSQITCCITVPWIVINAVTIATKLMFPSKISNLSWSRQQEFKHGFNWITKNDAMRRNENFGRESWLIINRVCWFWHLSEKPLCSQSQHFLSRLLGLLNYRHEWRKAHCTNLAVESTETM